MSSKFVLQQEDGTVENGNARGAYSVDLQMVRSSADQVASGNNSIIAGGVNNRAYGTGVFIGGGSNNAAGGADYYQVIAGGRYNSIVGSSHAFIGAGELNSIASGGNGYNVIAGGRSNTLSSQWGVISGGQANIASTNTHATVVGGYQNTASGGYSVAGGINSVASGYANVALGQIAVTSGYLSYAIGYRVAASGGGGDFVTGYRSTSNNTSTLVSGFKALGYLKGQVAHQGGFFDSEVFDPNGQLQFSTVNPYKSDTLASAATTVLSLDGTGTTNLIIPNGNNRAWNVQVKTVAVVTAITGTATGVSVGDTLMQDDKLLFSKVSGVSSVVGTTSQDFISSTSLGTASMSYSAGASQELALTFTAPTFAGGGSVTMRVVSKVELVEVAF